MHHHAANFADSWHKRRALLRLHLFAAKRQSFAKMYIQLLAPFALYAFVFANYYIEARKYYPYVLFNKTPEVEMSFPFQVKVPDIPIMFNLDLNVTDSLVNYTQAQSTYRIIYYNNESMVLGDKMPTVSERAICSLWVKENFTLESQIPFMANLSFHTNCKNALYYGYIDTCSK
ncbi:uncharacterized protein LOC142591081 isoform X3 [Dermacentor variabilis]|uniref:uncharacterized protein LOC142591081 isoform X3 n=1 Tax=Dermacentor variabilis TaxID=34621 RepID=UPI003F5AF745